MTLASRYDVDDRFILELAQVVGTENVHCEGAFYDECSHDATEIIRPPVAAIAVNEAAQIPAVLRIATRYGIPVIARGAGTGYTGGAVAEYGGIVVSLANLNRILDLDTGRRLAIVEPGVITQTLADAAAGKGLFYPPDPASVKECSLGGNIAECAGGLRCKKYGLTKDYVLGLEGYSADGELVQTGCFLPQQTYDLGSLLLGSEGTLAFITRIALQLIEPPQTRRTFFAAYESPTAAAEVVAAVLAAGVVPAVLEFMDGDAIKCTHEYLQWPATSPVAAALLVEVDGNATEVERDAAVVIEIMRRLRPTQFEETADPARRDHLWTLRRSISKAITAAATLRVSEDIVVPPSRLPTIVTALPDFARRHSLRVNSFGHAGDGNLHVNFLAGDDLPATRARIHEAVVELFKLTITLDGTISGEHGIGTTKKDYLPLEVADPTLELFRRVKRAFDPTGLLNPGKIF